MSLTNRAFTHGCALEHIVIPTCPLPSYWRTFYPCVMKWHCCKIYFPPYLACLVASNTMDAIRRSAFTKRTFYPCGMKLLQNLHSTLFGLSTDIKYHGLYTFHLPSIKRTQNNRLVNRIKVFNTRIKLHFQGYNWNSTLITNAIWWFETSNTHKDFTPPSQGIWQWLLDKQHKAHTLQRINEFKLQGLVLLPNNNKFCYQKMVEINPLSIELLKSKMKVFGCFTYDD